MRSRCAPTDAMFLFKNGFLISIFSRTQTHCYSKSEKFKSQLFCGYFYKALFRSSHNTATNFKNDVSIKLL